jgi:hypothetical protein
MSTPPAKGETSATDVPRGRIDMPRWGAGAITAVMFLLCLSHLLFGFDPLDWLPAQSICVFKVATGKPCPGCGMSHAFIHISQYKFQTAFFENPFSIPLFLIIAFYFFNGDLPRVMKSPVFLYSMLGLVFLWWGARLFLGM